MDNLTHSLVGVFLSRVGLNRLAPDATWILLIAANAPDVDVVSAFWGPAATMHWHRNFTHSLAFSPVMAIASVALVRLFMRKNIRWAGAVFIAWLAILSHILLDLTNNYGVRILEPFSGRWFHWDNTFVVDPWIWAVLSIAFLAPLLGRLVSSEMGQRRSAYPSRGWPICALMFLLLYDTGRAILHARALAVMNARLYSGQEPTRVAAFPTPLNPMDWQGLVETSDRYLLSALNLAGEFDPGSARVFYKGDPDGALAILRKQRDFGAMIDFAQYPLWRVIDDDRNVRYVLTDLRFGSPVTGTMTCSARVANGQSVEDEHCNFSFAPSFGRD
jgi:inner membrane protein